MSSVVKQGRKGLTMYNPTKACNGYNLFWPMGTKNCWLMDMEGRLVHWWRMPLHPAVHAILLPNGNLLGAGKVKEHTEYPYGWTTVFRGVGGLLFELDWDSNIVWKAEAPCQAHDFAPMENGHIMYIAWEPKFVLKSSGYKNEYINIGKNIKSFSYQHPIGFLKQYISDFIYSSGDKRRKSIHISHCRVHTWIADVERPPKGNKERTH